MALLWTADANHFTVDDNTYHTADGWHALLGNISQSLPALTQAANGTFEPSNRNVNGSIESILLTEAAASIKFNRSVAGAVVQVVATEAQAAVNSNRNVSAVTESLLLSTAGSTVTRTVKRNVVGVTQSMVLAAAAGTVNRSRGIQTPNEQLVITVLPGQVERNLLVSGVAEQIQAATAGAVVNRARNVACTPESVVVAAGSQVNRSRNVIGITEEIVLDLSTPRFIAGETAVIVLQTGAATIQRTFHVAGTTEQIVMTTGQGWVTKPTFGGITTDIVWPIVTYTGVTGRGLRP